MLEREEYIEQAYFFRVLLERIGSNIPLQELLEQSKFEILASTKLPMAIDLLLSELKHRGSMSGGMRTLKHYFVPFQTFLIDEAEQERGRFDYRTAFRVLGAEAEYRVSERFTAPGLFFFHIEALSRNRLNYDRGLLAMSQDPGYSSEWQEWLLYVRKQLGLVDLAEMIYARSEFCRDRQLARGLSVAPIPILFSQSEGKIALANVRKDPLFLFAAMQRQLGYPPVPKVERVDDAPEVIPRMQRRMEQLEQRIKLLEQEQRGGIDITKFYGASVPRTPSSQDPEK